VPGKGLDLKLEPVIRHSQFDARITTLNLYWEGAVKLSGSQGGVGFMELSGYEGVRAK
jgi:predicted secreted hydrolase